MDNNTNTNTVVLKSDKINIDPPKPSNNTDRDVNIGLDLLVNSDKHVPNVSSPKQESRDPIVEKPTPSISLSGEMSPTKVWSDMTSNINTDIKVVKEPSNSSSQPIIPDIEIDIEPPKEVILPKPDSVAPSIKVKKPKSPREDRQPTSKDIYFQKIELLQKINKIKRMGYVVPELSPSDEYDTIKIEYEKLKKIKESENSIKFSRKMLTAVVTAIEFLNNKFDPFDLELNGWSESVNENIEDYDDVFEALAEKYKGKSNMAPELKLLLMLGGSGFMFHLSNSMFKKMQNPDSMLNGVMGNLMGGGGGGGGRGGPNPMEAMMGMMGGGGRSSMPQRKEMNGPSGVDDILKHIQSRGNNNNSTGSRSRNNKTKGISLDI